jgi:hypothetical protein
VASGSLPATTSCAPPAARQASKRGIHNAASAGSRGTKQKSSGSTGVPGRRNGAVRAAASAGARGAGAPKSGQ